MKIILLCFLLIFFGFFCAAQPQPKQEKPDTTTVEKTIDRWVDSLNTRKFSEDSEKLKEDIKGLGIKTKKSIERNVPKVKKLFKEIEDYLRR